MSYTYERLLVIESWSNPYFTYSRYIASTNQTFTGNAYIPVPTWSTSVMGYEYPNRLRVIAENSRIQSLVTNAPSTYRIVVNGTVIAYGQIGDSFGFGYKFVFLLQN